MVKIDNSYFYPQFFSNLISFFLLLLPVTTLSAQQIEIIPNSSTYQEVIEILGDPEEVKMDKKISADIDVGERLILLYPKLGINIGFKDPVIENNPKIHSAGYYPPFNTEGPGKLKIGMGRNEALSRLRKRYDEILTENNRSVFKRNWPRKEELFLIFSNEKLVWIKHFQTSGLLPALYSMKEGGQKEKFSVHNPQEQAVYDFFYASQKGMGSLFLYSASRIFSFRFWLILFSLLAGPAFFAIILTQFDNPMLSQEMTAWIQRISFLIVFIASILLFQHFTGMYLIWLIPVGFLLFILFIVIRRVKLFYWKKFGKTGSSSEWVCRNCGAVNDNVMVECGNCGTSNR